MMSLRSYGLLFSALTRAGSFWQKEQIKALTNSAYFLNKKSSFSSAVCSLFRFCISKLASLPWKKNVKNQCWPCSRMLVFPTDHLQIRINLLQIRINLSQTTNFPEPPIQFSLPIRKYNPCFSEWGLDRVMQGQIHGRTSIYVCQNSIPQIPHYSPSCILNILKISV